MGTWNYVHRVNNIHDDMCVCVGLWSCENGIMGTDYLDDLYVVWLCRRYICCLIMWKIYMLYDYVGRYMLIMGTDNVDDIYVCSYILYILYEYIYYVDDIRCRWYIYEYIFIWYMYEYICKTWIYI